MTSKQYIYTGSGNPTSNDVMPDAVTAHYLDVDSRDIWLWDADDWRRIYVGGSEGNIALFEGYDEPSESPTGPSIYTAYGGGNFRMYIAIFKSGEYWAWEEVQLVTNLTE